MTNDDDHIFYGAYGAVFVFLGLWIFIWAMDLITSMTAVLLWVLSIGVIAMYVANMSQQHGKKEGQKNVFGLGFGLFLVIVSVAGLAVVNEVLNSTAAIGVIILVIGIGILVFAISVKK